MGNDDREDDDVSLSLSGMEDPYVLIFSETGSC
jgi:hypothetical protein